MAASASQAARMESGGVSGPAWKSAAKPRRSRDDEPSGFVSSMRSCQTRNDGAQIREVQAAGQVFR